MRTGVMCPKGIICHYVGRKQKHKSSRSISAGLPISYCFHAKVGSAIGRQVSPVIPEVSRRCDVTPEVETVTYRVYRVLSQQVCVLDKR